MKRINKKKIFPKDPKEVEKAIKKAQGILKGILSTEEYFKMKQEEKLLEEEKWNRLFPKK